MNVLEDYIAKHANYKPFINEPPDKKIQNIIVIPAIGEPELLNTIKSIWHCTRPSQPIEIIVVINSSEISIPEITELNLRNIMAIENWAKHYNSEFLKVYAIHIYNISKKDAGAGFARKTGMDEAVSRYIKAGAKGGIISSLDADSVVEKNYLVEIEKLFNQKKKCDACSIYFEHPTHGNEYDSNVYQKITEYELHLRYFRLMLKYIGFPYYYHTVGSSFAVSVEAYCRQGGMNKKKAGEDFYFLHKLMPLENYYELNSTCVYPSARPSDRVPFGTGATILQYLHLTEEYKTYNINAFNPLKNLFAQKESFYGLESNSYEEAIATYDKILVDFLESNNFKEAIIEMNANTNNIQSFIKRFFNWFDAFRIIKYINYSHLNHFMKQDICEAANELLKILGVEKQSKNSKNLLDTYRMQEKAELYP